MRPPPLAILLALAPLCGCGTVPPSSTAAPAAGTGAAVTALADSILMAARARDADRFAAFFASGDDVVYVLNTRQLASQGAVRDAFRNMLTRQREFDARWTEGRAEAITRPAKLTMAFTSINVEEGTADAVDDTRKSHITVRVIGNYMNFMQIDAYGALYVTTVFNADARSDSLLAVHTRHEYTPVQLRGLTSRPEQYYGDCEVK